MVSFFAVYHSNFYSLFPIANVLTVILDLMFQQNSRFRQMKKKMGKETEGNCSKENERKEHVAYIKTHALRREANMKCNVDQKARGVCFWDHKY